MIARPPMTRGDARREGLGAAIHGGQSRERSLGRRDRIQPPSRCRACGVHREAHRAPPTPGCGSSGATASSSPIPSTSTTSRTCSGVTRAATTRPGQRPVGVHRAAPSAVRRPRRRRPDVRGRPSQHAGPRRRPRAPGRSRGRARSRGRRGRARPRRSRPAGRSAVPHHRHPVGDRERLLVVVGDHQRGGPGLARGSSRRSVGEPLAQPGVEGGQRLVEQQQPGLDGERTGQRDPLPLAAGQRGRQPVGVPLQADQREQLLDPGRDAGRTAPEPQRVADVARRRSGGRRAGRPGTSARSRACGSARRRGRRRPRRRVPAVERLEPGDRAQQRRLAAAGRAEHREHLAVGQLEGRRRRRPARRRTTRRRRLERQHQNAPTTRTPEPLDGEHHERGGGGQHDRRGERHAEVLVAGAADQLVDHDRQGRVVVAGQERGGAELAERDREREAGRGQQRPPHDRQVDGRERPQRAGAQRRGGLALAVVDRRRARARACAPPAAARPAPGRSAPAAASRAGRAAAGRG